MANSNFFEQMSNNIVHYLKVDQKHAFSAENLKRTLKVVNLLRKDKFLYIAKHHTWSKMIGFIDKAKSEEEFFKYFKKVNNDSK